MDGSENGKSYYLQLLNEFLSECSLDFIVYLYYFAKEKKKRSV